MSTRNTDASKYGQGMNMNERKQKTILLSALLLISLSIGTVAVPAGKIPSGRSPSSGLAYLIKLHRTGQAFPADLAQSLHVQKLEEIQMLPGAQNDLFYVTDLSGQPLDEPQFAGRSNAADVALFPTISSGDSAEIVFAGRDTDVGQNIGFLNTLDFTSLNFPFDAVLPTWWDHPAIVPGVDGQFATAIFSPRFDDTPSAEQGNEIPAKSSQKSGRGGILDVGIVYLGAVATNGATPLRIPQHALTFRADGQKYVIEFLTSHLVFAGPTACAVGCFVWGPFTELTDLAPAVNVAWPDSNFFGFTGHGFRAIIVVTGDNMMIGGSEHQIVHLFARNPGENFLGVLQDHQRRL